MRLGIKPLNDLSGRAWTQMSKSIQLFNGSIASKRRRHGAAFPLKLAEHFIALLTMPGDVVLDPFLGVGTTSDACSLMGRQCIGFEVNREYYDLAISGQEECDIRAMASHATAQGLFEQGTPQRQLFNESCESMAARVRPSTIDLTLTSPPYGNLLRRVAAHFANYTYEKNIYRGQGRTLAKPYSDLAEDFGNLDWPAYLERIAELMASLYEVARPGGYNVWVLRDFRDVEHHIPYIPVHSKIAELATTAGWILTDIVIWDQTNQRKLVKLGGIKQRRFYFNIGHSYILILRKNLDGERFRNIW
jgi:DNA modification methylase